MGAFYVTATVADAAHEQVLEGLHHVRSFVGPRHDRFTVIYPDFMAINPADFSSTWPRLSASLHAPIFVAVVMDDDVLYYELWSKGELLDQYVSDPALWDDDPSKGHTPTGGNPEKLCAIFACKDVEAVSRILGTTHKAQEYVIESERHADLAKALGLPASSVYMGYSYIENGESPDGVSRNDLIHLPR